MFQMDSNVHSVKTSCYFVLMDQKYIHHSFDGWFVDRTGGGKSGTFINVGAVFDSLKCADIPNFNILLPPIAEQKAIATLLGVLDDKIENNRALNHHLEQAARALFKSWFIDFDPVRAKLDGRRPPRPRPCHRRSLPRLLPGLRTRSHSKGMGDRLHSQADFFAQRWNTQDRSTGVLEWPSPLG